MAARLLGACMAEPGAITSMISKPGRRHEAPVPIMNEGHDLPLFEAGDRREEADRRARILRWRCSMGISALALFALTAVIPPAPRLMWNASASAPRGLYRVAPGASVARRDMVLAWAPAGARMLAAQRHYLPLGVPLVKRVAAVAGQRVCASGSEIRIDGAHAAWRLRHDAAGRSMPWWSGCVTLGISETFLLNAPPASFDGRYFGPSKRDDVIGRAVPVWTFQ